MLRKFVFAAAMALIAAPAFAQLADEMTCKQAVTYYEKHGVIQVIANGKFAVPVKVGVPVSQASTLQCEGEGQQPRAYTVSTRDAWRCTIAMTC
ncbi:hypothetical protein EJC49_04555 [Aquibium carbonis]|uniref:Uncharacterized protein n=1 Tax=Aquibium carbonis TaxID=2495581 RepID=A0A3R9YBP0_9HYPH|nr:hypothetical protein [Aquibium carbonis]RST87624.1 hypothetical protein EJC49_04555 [Aquibium carbonis]